MMSTTLSGDLEPLKIDLRRLNFLYTASLDFNSPFFINNTPNDP